MKKLKICIDFDGVIHSYTSKWKFADLIPDPPVAGMVEWIRDRLTEGHSVSIYSMRNSSDTYLRNLEDQVDAYEAGGSGYQPVIVDIESISKARKAIREWFLKYGLEQSLVDKLKFPVGKPHFDITIDDRGFRFEGSPPNLSAESLKPWNK